MARTTIKYVERRVKTLNEITNSPAEPWIKTSDGLRAEIGNYHLDRAYGGVRLVRHVTESGGCRDISPRLSTKALADWINAYIDGIVIGRGMN